VQSDLHPLLSSKLPSSHCSTDNLLLSPQIGLQTDGLDELPPTQFHPAITPEQPVKHPLLSVLFPSSQVSGDIKIPSPHKILQLEV